MIVYCYHHCLQSSDGCEEAGRFTRLRENDSVLEVASFASCA